MHHDLGVQLPRGADDAAGVAPTQARAAGPARRQRPAKGRLDAQADARKPPTTKNAGGQGKQVRTPAYAPVCVGRSAYLTEQKRTGFGPPEVATGMNVGS